MWRSDATIISVEVPDVAPIVSSMKICTSPSVSNCEPVAEYLTTAINLERDYDLWAVVSDGNGAADLDSAIIQGSLFRTGIQPYACDAPSESDGNFCYPVIACTTETFINMTTVAVKCPVGLKYWADPTTAGASNYADDSWTARVEVREVGFDVGFASVLTEVAEMAAVDVSAELKGLDGSLGQGFDFEVSLVNYGNVDVEVSALVDPSLDCGGELFAKHWFVPSRRSEETPETHNNYVELQVKSVDRLEQCLAAATFVVRKSLE